MRDVISLQYIGKSYPSFALKDVSLTIPKGYITGIVGPNGSGKTTLLKIIMGTTHPDVGHVEVFGKTYEHHECDIKSQVGFVYDEPGLYLDMNVKTLGAMMRGFYEKWDDEVFRRYIDWFQLPSRKKVKKLSRGMKMKLGLAIALSHQADLILLDEPTAGLDPVIRREVLQEFSDIMQDEQKTILLSTHITTDLDRIADYITYMRDGDVLFNRAKEEIFETCLLVKGYSQSGDVLKHYNVIGHRETAFGREALIETESLQEREYLLEQADLFVDKPNLEDIIYYYHSDRRVGC